MFENHRKSLIQHCERSELRLHFEWTKVNSNCQKWSIWASFWKPEACGQTVLPDRSVLMGQKLVENAKTKKFKCDILRNFQTMISTILLRKFKLYFSLKKFTKNVNSPQFVRQFMLPLWVLRIDDSTLFHTCFFYYLRTDVWRSRGLFLTQLLNESRTLKVT